jgi:D-glycero-alpha-D-manno-heptose-7-phosphate kinase
MAERGDAEIPAEERPLVRAALGRAGLGDVIVHMRHDYPVGAGLGGSSAAGVVLTGALSAWRGEDPSRIELAERSRAVEVEDLGIAGGRQDHYAAAFGGALGLWFTDDVRVEQVPVSAAMADSIARQCLVIYTGATRISGATITAVLDAYRARSAPVLAALARMKALAAQMIGALRRESLHELGMLIDEHWAHQRSLHPAITTPRIEEIIARARAAGASGAKALGASGGGCVLVLAPADAVERVRAAIAPLGALLPATVDTRGFDLVREIGAAR